MAECSSAESVLEAAALIKANGGKIDQFVNGGAFEEVQLGVGQPTPTLKNVVRQMETAAAEIDGTDISGKFSDAASGGETLRTLTSRFGDIVNVKDFGAVGDGVTNDCNAILTAATLGKPLFFPEGTYKIVANYDDDVGLIGCVPDVDMVGPGKIVVDGLPVSSGGWISYNPVRENITYIPGDFVRSLRGINYPPPQIKDHNKNCYVTAFSVGSKLIDPSKRIKRVTAVGNGCGSAPIEWQVTDCFGADSMMYAGYSSRNVAIGSETMVWGGAPSQQWLIDYKHDWWRHAPEMPYYPGEDGWNNLGISDIFPDIGTRIDAFSDYATKIEDFEYNTALGRDALVHFVRGWGNLACGYQVAAQLFSGNANVALGNAALHNAVFVNYDVAVGSEAGRDNLDGAGNTFVGNAAGRAVRGGTGGVFIGSQAAYGTTSADEAIIIGHNAGKSIANLDNCLFIGTSATVPAIGGDLANSKICINLPPASLRARLHVRGASATGSTLAPTYDGLLVEGGYSAGVTVECGSYGGLFFATSSSTNGCGLVFSASTSRLKVKAGGDVAAFGSDFFRPTTTSVTNLGGASNLWKEVFAASATINTSDRRQKTDISDPDEALLNAWGKVGVKLFRMKDAVAEKGESARIHAGVVAQDVAEAFASEGLDASRYGLFCHDEWDAQPEEVDAGGNVMEPAREAGDAYGIRYAEALALECAYLRSRLATIDDRLSALGG